MNANNIVLYLFTVFALWTGNTFATLPNSLYLNSPAIDRSDLSEQDERINPRLTQRSDGLCQFGSQDIPCSPPFQNIAQFASIQASSTCGYPRIQRICHTDGTCQVCDQTMKSSRFDQGFLLDSHLSNNRTCWSSGYARSGGLENAVNLTLSLRKRFEVSHVTLVPCDYGKLSDSVAIFKSSDFGRNWKPWHYFSTDCYRAFGLPTTDQYNSYMSSANLQEVQCNALRPHQTYFTEQSRKRPSRFIRLKQNLDMAITFSTTLGRPSSRPWSPALVDWMTMTDIQISLMRFPTDRTEQAIGSNENSKWNKDKQNPYSAVNNSLDLLRWHGNPWLPIGLGRDDDKFRLPNLDYMLRKTKRSLEESYIPVSAASWSDPPIEPDVLSAGEFYSFANLRVGGWCKCNGHASECQLGPEGRLRCVCQHNTDGTDCERCKPGYMDRPWDRATLSNANSCTRCECNLHSSECRFSNALYLMSNRMSGGVCENCQHNTAGRHCQHCAEGFYRDWTKPPSHDGVCLPCRCHPIGSINRHECDRRSGQCRCKQGVTGLTCDRCQDGYHQTRSPKNPCTKDIPSQAFALAHTQKDIRCHTCETNKERIRLKKFCRKDAVLHAAFRSRELHGLMARFEMIVHHVWRLDPKVFYGPHAPFWPLTYSGDSDGSPQTRVDVTPTNEVPVWVHLNDLRCKCPEIQLGISYLIVTDVSTYYNKGRAELLFTPKSALLPWRSTWRRRLMRLQRRHNRGACIRFHDSGKLNNATQAATVSAIWTRKSRDTVPSRNVYPLPNYTYRRYRPYYK